MNLGEILAQCRDELDDVEQDYLWSDALLISHINEAEREACRRARLLVDATTAEVCTINVAAGTALYDLHAAVIRPRTAIASWQTQPLKLVTTVMMDECEAGWRTREGAPRRIVIDYETGKIRFDRIPQEAGTVQLRVFRLPLNRMTALSDVPEIKEQYHDKLVHWVKHRAYMKKDADTYDKAASLEALAFFEQEFGDKKSAWADEFDLMNLPFADEQGAY